MSMGKAVIYARYSSDRQTEQSIEGQVRECENFAKSRNISIIGKYVDRALTGKVDSRPDFVRMIKDSHKGLFDYVIVYQLDRFSRSKYDSAHYKHILKKNGVRVLSAKENITDDPSGILMETMLEGMAEYYSAELAQKVRRGMFEGFLKGHTSGSGCYGFDIIPIDITSNAKKFAVNKVEAGVIKKVFEDYASGVKIKDILVWLETNNIKSRRGQSFHYSSIMHMLTNAKYIGTLTFGGESRENVLPAIVSKDLFDQVQARVNKNKRNPNWFKSKERFLLSNKTVCGHCHSPIIAESGTNSKGTVYRYYKCFNKKKAKVPCEKTQFNKQKLEDLVIFSTQKLLAEKGLIEKIAAQVVAFGDETQTNPKLEMYQKQLAETQKALANMVKAVQQGLFNPTMQESMLKLESDKADLQWRIDGEKINVPIKLDHLQTIYWFKQFAEGNANDTPFRERLVDAFINKVILWNDKAIIVYNIKGTDGDKITTEQIIADFEQQKNEPTTQMFDSLSCGGPDAT